MPLCVRKNNLFMAEGLPGKLVVRSMQQGPRTDAAFKAADLVGDDPSLMDNFWINARNKLRERYKWPKGHFTMIDEISPLTSSRTPYMCVFRSDIRLASLVHAKSILIVK